MEKSKFKTDSDISKSKFKERELAKWVPEDDLKLALDETQHKPGNWDQFKANQERFGIDSTYDETLYTTRVNTEAKDFQQRLKKAEQLASEIEGSVSSDPHIMEERGKIDDSGIDEEDKYSGVARTLESLDKKDTRGDELMAALKSVSINGKDGASKPHDQGFPTAAKKPLSNGKPKPTSIPSKPTNESFTLNAQSEINSLKEFSATFKVPHKIPNDLLPILAKDKSKQDEILKKSETKSLTSSNNSRNNSNSNLLNNNTKKKMDPTKPAFKLNPKAAAFVPGINKPAPKYNQHHHYSRSPNNSSPRMNNQRPYSLVSASSISSAKRHYQISPSDFFGGANKIPTKELQLKKVNTLKMSFNLFVANKPQTPEGTIAIEKTYITPPTWDLTVDETHDKLFTVPEYVQILPYSGAYPFNSVYNPMNPGALYSGQYGMGIPIQMMNPNGMIGMIPGMIPGMINPMLSPQQAQFQNMNTFNTQANYLPQPQTYGTSSTPPLSGQPIEPQISSNGESPSVESPNLSQTTMNYQHLGYNYGYSYNSGKRYQKRTT